MKIHTIQLNIEDFEAGTCHMNATEKGAYISLLLCLYKTSSNKIDDDDTRLARMACVTPHQWKKIRKVLEPKFIITDGSWTNKRVSEEAVLYRKISKKNRANALKKKETGEPVGERSQSQNEANINIYNLESSNYISNLTDSKTDSRDSDFFNIYDFYDGDGPAITQLRNYTNGMDIFFLFEKYNEFVNSPQGKIPKHPEKAFTAWLKSYTKGYTPS